jgi:hypothetical protein
MQSRSFSVLATAQHSPWWIWAAEQKSALAATVAGTAVVTAAVTAAAVPEAEVPVPEEPVPEAGELAPGPVLAVVELAEAEVLGPEPGVAVQPLEQVPAEPVLVVLAEVVVPVQGVAEPEPELAAQVLEAPVPVVPAVELPAVAPVQAEPVVQLLAEAPPVAQPRAWAETARLGRQASGAA